MARPKSLPPTDQDLALGQDFAAALLAFQTAAAERLGLSSTDRKSLERIAREGGVTAGRLAELTDLTTGAVTGLIDRLERAGFAARVPHPKDRRVVRIEANPERRAEIDALFAPVIAAMTALNDEFSSEELGTIARYLGRVTEIMTTEAQRLKEGDRKR